MQAVAKTKVSPKVTQTLPWACLAHWPVEKVNGLFPNWEVDTEAIILFKFKLLCDLGVTLGVFGRKIA